jgi:transcriptional regulator with XRE-family HTH domain
MAREEMQERGVTRLRRWRLEQCLQVSEVVDLTGVRETTWCDYESGRRRVMPKVRVLIARRLGARVRDLFEPEPVEGIDPDQIVSGVQAQ